MECLGAQYYDPLTQLCKNCHSDCRRCTGPGKFSCAACSPPLHLDKLNNQCVPCCTGNEKGSQAEECCLCDPETGKSINRVLSVVFCVRKFEIALFRVLLGGCRNSSPAGKRRVPGTEFASADSSISEVYASYEGTTDKNDSASLAITATTTIAVAICLVSVALFATIFIALQVRSISSRPLCTLWSKERYRRNAVTAAKENEQNRFCTIVQRTMTEQGNVPSYVSLL